MIHSVRMIWHNIAGVNHVIHCITNVYLTAEVPPVSITLSKFLQI